MERNYFTVEIERKEDPGNTFRIVLEENVLVDFLKNLDVAQYTLLNVYGNGALYFNHRDFLKKETGLEVGKKEDINVN